MTAPPEFVSRDFKLSEFAVSGAFPKLVRPVPQALVARVQMLATHGLQPIRDAIQRPMRITSGYRSQVLNIALKGSPTSQHVVAEAADWTCEDIEEARETVIDMVRDGKLRHIGQIIFYPARGFNHIALASGRFPRPTLCVHWPERGLSYHQFAPDREAYAAILRRAEEGAS